MDDKERNRQFSRARARVLSTKTDIQRDTFAAIEGLLNEAGDQINTTLAATPTDYQAWQLPQLQQAINQATNELAELSTGRLSQGAGQMRQAGIDLLDAPIAAGGINISAVLPEIDTQQLLTMRAFMTDRIKDVSLKLANSINSELGLVAIGAKTPGEAITNIAALLDSSRSRAITITRTELGRVFSVASQERFEQASEILPGLKKQWRRSGKIHSRFHHDAADGQIQDVDKPFKLYPKTGMIKLMYPRDPAASAGETINCGCDSIPYMENWDVKNPGKIPFTDEELRLSANKRALADTSLLSDIA